MELKSTMIEINEQIRRVTTLYFPKVFITQNFCKFITICFKISVKKTNVILTIIVKCIMFMKNI